MQLFLDHSDALVGYNVHVVLSIWYNVVCSGQSNTLTHTGHKVLDTVVYCWLDLREMARLLSLRSVCVEFIYLYSDHYNV